MARTPIQTWTYALVVVRLGRRFLVVRENKGQQAWYLPAGRVEPGETLHNAARRETMEEAGVAINLEGVLRVEHTPQIDGSARCRVFFVATPADDTAPKSVADQESIEARWVTLEQMAQMELRSPEVLEIFSYVAGGGPVYPLGILAQERQRFHLS